VPSCNLQSVVDVESGLIVHHDVYNDANDSHPLHPMSVAALSILAFNILHAANAFGTAAVTPCRGASPSRFGRA
jgi:hypothetical protein